MRLSFTPGKQAFAQAAAVSADMQTMVLASGTQHRDKAQWSLPTAAWSGGFIQILQPSEKV